DGARLPDVIDALDMRRRQVTVIEAHGHDVILEHLTLGELARGAAAKRGRAAKGLVHGGSELRAIDVRRGEVEQQLRGGALELLSQALDDARDVLGRRAGDLHGHGWSLNVAMS